MARYNANTGSGEWEEGTVYNLTIDSVEAKVGEFGPQVLFIFTVGDSDETLWTWASPKLGKHQGRVSKLRGIANAAFGRSEGDEISWFDDETMEIKYPDEDTPRKIEEGLRLRGRGEYFEGKDGPRFKLTRFAMLQPVGAGASKAHTSGQVTVDEVPF